jgi:6-phosphofructokinase 1
MTKKIAVFTSGGDAPGMNAAIRSIVRVGVEEGYAVMGIQGGYQGLIDGDLIHLGPRTVSNILQRGGTVIRTSRSEEFKTAAGREKARAVLEEHNIEALMAIGGDGTFHGAVALSKIWKGKIIGIPGTIDNDLYGTDFTIGYDTAVNTALECIDKIRDTAEAHERMFLIEVMGRHAGFIALESGVAGGAEEILLPEYPCNLKEVSERLHERKRKGKTSALIVVAEGCSEGNAYQVAEKLKRMEHGDYRIVVLGYIQRGGTPSSRDRVLATKLGAYAVEVASKGISGVMVGEVAGELVTTPLPDTWEKKKGLDQMLLALAPKLAT